MIAIHRTLRSSMLRHIKNARPRVALAALLLVSYAFISILQPIIAEAGIANWTPPVISDVTAGRDSSCAVADGRAYCWGRNDYGQLGTPDVASTTYSAVPVPVDTSGLLANRRVTKIEGGTLRTYCAIADGQPYCWGNNQYGSFGNGTNGAGNTSNVPVATNVSGLLAGKTVTDISLGDGHTCAVADGAAYCWGTGGGGRLGDGYTTTRLTPAAVVGYTGTVTAVAAASGHGCAVVSGAAYCWGANNLNQLGNGSTTGSNSATPVDVSVNSALHGKTVVDIDAGSSTTCALTSDGMAACWGEGLSGAVGNGQNTVTPIPSAVTGAVSGKNLVSLRMQANRACVLDDTGAAYCWGSSAGDGSGGTRTSSVAISTISTTLLYNKTLTGIGLGDSIQSCATAGTELYCWGINTYGQLGNNTNVTSYAPVQVKFNHSFNGNSYRFYENADSATPGAPLAAADVPATLSSSNQAFRLRTGIKTYAAMGSVASGTNHTCALSNNKVYCWGAGNLGQLGNGGTADSMVPVAVTMSGALSGKIVSAVAAGGDTTCVIASGQAYCWGAGADGRLGNSDNSNSLVPVAVTTSGVLNNKTINSISVGGAHACVIANDGLPFCWGLGTSGQLGNSGITSSNVPEAVTMTGLSSLTGRKGISISAGGNFTCLVADNKTAHCWGEGSLGQLGSSISSSSYPKAVNTTGDLSGKSVSYVSAGMSHACVVTLDNLAFCWGGNFSGQLGNGGTSTSTVPVAVDTSVALNGKAIKTVTAGVASSCAVDTAGKAYCWGDNTEGQLGDNSSLTQSATPVAVYAGDALNGKVVQTVESGDSHICTVTKSEQVYCWGKNDKGQIGNNSTTGALAPKAPLISNNIPGARILANDSNTYRLQFATKTQTTCSVQTGYGDVTISSIIAWNTNGSVANGSVITTNANDPVPTSVGVAQTYQSTAGAFTNPNMIDSSKMGLWDFSLKDNGSPMNTTYCFRIAYGDGTAVESYTQFPQITTNPGILSIDFVNSGGTVLNNPIVPLSLRNVSTSCQTSTGSLTSLSRRLRITNSLTNNWSVSLEASGGTASSWMRGDLLAQYDFNDPNGCADGADSDSVGGQLTVNPGTDVLAQSGCLVSGASPGSTAAFSEGSVDSVNLFSSNINSQIGCYYDFPGISLSQTIPASQPAGDYSINMTATVVSQ